MEGWSVIKTGRRHWEEEKRRVKGVAMWRWVGMLAEQFLGSWGRQVTLLPGQDCRPRTGPECHLQSLC